MAPAAVSDLSLSERLAEARRAAQEPSRHLAETEAALMVAEDRKDYDEAKRLSGELPGAREAALIADVTVRALADAEQSLGAQLAEEQRAASLAGQQAEAQRLLGDAMAAEKTALGEIEENLSQFWAFVGAAQDAFRAAQGSESGALAARLRMIQARILAGDTPAPVPTPVKLDDYQQAPCIHCLFTPKSVTRRQSWVISVTRDQDRGPQARHRTVVPERPCEHWEERR